MSFTFTLLKVHHKARAGVLQTPHGEVVTPIFMPVGTQASVKSLDSADIAATGAQIILANTYHLYLRPGEETVHSLGGVQEMMNWKRPMLTDSGGFQVFSLGKQLAQKRAAQQPSSTKSSLVPATITNEGVSFTSHLDGSKHFISPEKSIAIQQAIGADIIMAFDECTPDTASYDETAQAAERTFDWAGRCIDQWNATDRRSRQGSYQALFGIVQGAMHEELRKQCASQICSLPFDGIAVGGETIGYNMAGTASVMEWIETLLPENKPRYAMGLGSCPQDIVDAILLGFDVFDCVAPTRLARNGALFVGKLNPTTLKIESSLNKNRLLIGNQQYTVDTQVIDPGCDCTTCTSGYTRAYLHHLYKTAELAYYRLASVHNVRAMIRTSEEMRAIILAS
ncbi:tRNA guanosine(34) transglycosylase Tgt [Candidatus Woesebacteria bacterium]|nr:tRNA guanosine(34) transglycosylase Tgt [Candidatus Woesebacteria bacterium]